MVAVTIQLPDKVAEQLNERAKQRQTTLEALIADNITSLVPHEDAEFRHKLDRILAEDHELLRRLA